jgi:hypothetical protein
VNVDCGHNWEREFLDNQLTRTFRLTTYKEHREKVLIDRERSRLPATQEDALRYKRAVETMKLCSEEEIRLLEQLETIQNQLYQVQNRKYDARRVTRSFGAYIIDNNTTVDEHAKTFIKACPASDCKGFLSTAWKCGMCEQWTCPDCHDLKGRDKNVEHTCDPDKVATAHLLSKDSKSCPKCGVSITKIDGCDQMFCTVCNTGFNWRTGKIASGPIHNPHYFEWLRTQGREPTQANAGAGVPNCEINLDRRIINILDPYRCSGVRFSEKNPSKQYLLKVWRFMREIEDTNRREINLDDKFLQLRVRFMANEITEDEWKTLLQRQEKDVNFQRTVRQVREVFVQASRDIIRQILNNDYIIDDICNQVREIIAYCNECFTNISKRFGRKVPKFFETP